MRCWLSAASPTSNSPEGAMPTQDGSILLWLGPRTRTWPSTNAATSELVVPRSIPTTGSLNAHPVPRPPGHPHLRRPEQFAIPFVAHTVHRKHGSLRGPVRLLHINGVHTPRIERLPLALDGLNLKLKKQIVQMAQAQAVAILQSAHYVESVLHLPPPCRKQAVPQIGLHLFPSAHRRR